MVRYKNSNDFVNNEEVSLTSFIFQNTLLVNSRNVSMFTVKIIIKSLEHNSDPVKSDIFLSKYCIHYGKKFVILIE